ncbi:TNT domain-containing protein [Arthrobacter pigmenti]
MGFNPSSFPPIADAARLRTEAEKFKTKADKVEDLASDSFNSWSSMPGVYEAPEASIVYGAFAPVKTSGQDLAGDAATVKSAIDTYAGEAESIKGRYDALMVRWRSVEAQKAADDEWQEDEDLVKEDNDILSDANALMAEYMAAQRTCANKISGIYGGPTYVPTTQEGAGPGEVQYGFTGEQLDAAAAEGKLPWGEPSEYDAPWYEDSWNAVKSFGKGVWSGVTGTVTGLWNMVNFTDWDTFSTTWKGIATLAVDVAVVSRPGIQTSSRAMEARERLLAVGKSAIHWDEWQEDPAYAAGASTFDLATILLTAGAGAVTKTGSVASKVSTVAGAGTKAGTAVKVTGLGTVARTTVKVTDLAADLKIKSLDLGTSVAQNSLGKLAPVATRLDDGINAMSGPQPAHARVGSSGPRPFSDALDAGISRMDSHSNGGGSGAPAGGTTGLDSGSNAPATTGPQGGSPEGGGSDVDAPVAGGDVGGAPDGGSSDGREPAAAGDTAGPGSSAPDDGGPGKGVPEGDGSGAPDQAQRNYADVEGQRVDPAYEHPPAEHGVEVDDNISKPAEHAQYGLHNPDGPTDTALEGKARYPDEINPQLEEIVNSDQPKYGVDEHGHALSEEEYVNRYGVFNEKTDLWEYYDYPDNDGAVEGSIRSYDSMHGLLADFPGLELDRIGDNSGGYFAVEGTPWHMRSLPVNSLGKELHHFDLGELPNDIEVKVSEVAPAFGRPGGGTQLEFIDVGHGGPRLIVDELLARNVLLD